MRALVILAVLLVGCSSPERDLTTAPPPESAAASESEPASEAPSATPEPTEEPTPEPTEAPPEGELEKTAELIFVDPDPFSSDFVTAWVVLEVTNVGDGWAQQIPFEADYTIYGPDDSVTATGNFLYAYPEYIAPGERGYLFTEHVESGVAPEAFARMEADGQYEAVVDPGPLFSFDGVQYRPDEFSGALLATGEITNESAEDIESAAAGVIYFDGAGEVIGVTYTNLLQNLAAGQTKGFETVTGSVVDPAAVASFEVFAEDSGF